MISFVQDLQLTVDHTPVLAAQEIALLCAVDRITADELIAMVDQPAADISLKDWRG